MLWCVCLLTAGLLAPSPGVVGDWPFDGSLADVSGQGHAATGAARYAPSGDGQALAPEGRGVTVADHQDLRLAPGLTIETWVTFDRPLTGTEVLVIKDQEYQLRVDPPSEGGQFAFFTYLHGWEPRARGPVPQPGRTYHVVARWTGARIELEVNDERFTAPRRGTPNGTTNALAFGGTTARLDRVRISNPAAVRWRELERLAQQTPAAARSRQAAFGGEAGWAGWQGVAGATATMTGGALSGQLGDGAVAHGGLDLDLRGLRYVSVDLDAPGEGDAELYFLTDRGRGWATLPAWGGSRTAIADLAYATSWLGRLRMLAVVVPRPAGTTVTLRRLWVSAQPQGSPFLYLRSVAPGRAILRSGREETVIAVVRNLGRRAERVTAELAPPPGVTVLDQPVQSLGPLDYDDTSRVVWRVRADRPVTGRAEVRLRGDEQVATPGGVDLRVQPPVALPRATYVPAPQPVPSRYLTLMHYCPLWKEGTHYGWGKVEPWPERRPAIGYYDEGTPEVADWHIKYAVEHGVQGFIYCWYRRGYGAKIEQNLGHALEDGLLQARYLDRFQFSIMWENANAAGVKDSADLLDNVVPYWIKTYFLHPSYAKVDGKPLLFIWIPSKFTSDLGGVANAKAAIAAMRAACQRAGLPGLYVIGCVGTANAKVLGEMAEEGYDASTAYGLIGQDPDPPGRDVEGLVTINHAASLLGQEAIWKGKQAIGAVPDIIDVMMGWDPRPWHGPRTASYLAGARPEHFRAACLKARALLEARPGNGLDKRVLVFDNWNEFGEGHYLEPCSGDGFGYLDAIREVFSEATAPCQDLIPEDVGLAPPERVYAARRAILGGFADGPRRVVDHLVAWWRFDEADDQFARDASACGFHGVKDRFESVPGRVGNGFRCQGGTVTVGQHKLFWPSDGVTVELWLKAEQPNQTDRWMLNTVGASHTGYRLGLSNGCLTWQVPVTAWSHGVTAPQPLPLGQWVHVAATCDGQRLRLYQDGRQVAELPREGPIQPSLTNLCLGSYSPGHERAFFQGVIDEVRLWDRALTPAQIAARHKGDAPLFSIRPPG